MKEGELRRRLTSPRTLVVGSLNVRGCSSIESKRCEIGCMFGRRGMDVLALCETKMKGKGEVVFGEVTGRVSGVERGRAREGVALLLSEWMGNKVVEWKEVSSRLMWVRVRMGRECWAFVSAYFFFFFFFFMNGNTERAQCALSQVCIPCKKEKKCNKTIL